MGMMILIAAISLLVYAYEQSNESNFIESWV